MLNFVTFPKENPWENFSSRSHHSLHARLEKKILFQMSKRLHIITNFFSSRSIYSGQRSVETRINLLYSIYPDRKHRFGDEKKWIYRFKMVYFWLGRYCTNQLISLSEFPVIYGKLETVLKFELLWCFVTNISMLMVPVWIFKGDIEYDLWLL